MVKTELALQEIDMKVIIICGAICSGKSTYAARFKGGVTVDIGDIVREIKETAIRVHDKSLDQQIIASLRKRLSAFRKKELTIIVTGIRQTSILEALEAMLKKDTYAKVLLQVPTEVLKQRYKKRNALKDAKLSFEEATARDAALGYKELEDRLRQDKTVTIVKNYTRDEIDTLQKIEDRQDSTMDH